MIALDQLGFGQSDKPVIDYSIQTYVDFLNEFLHELKIEKATLVGESLAGWISALYTLEASRISAWFRWKDWCWWMRRVCSRTNRFPT